MKFDIVSDLHIDQWNPTYKISNPCGEVKNFPLKWNSTDNILIVAGDISDDLERSCKYLNDLSNYYSTILFVDGNHEHVNNYPDLYTSEEIKNSIDKYNKKNIKYLTKETFVKDKTAFIGCCGWWDYNNLDADEIKRSLSYFDEWIKKIDRQGSLDFINNVSKKAKAQTNMLIRRLEALEEDDTIEEIVIVTHCVPLPQFTDEGRLGTEHNNGFQKILNRNFKKLKKWIFGHTHQHFDEKIKGVHFMANARGRPEDFDRINYQILNTKL